MAHKRILPWLRSELKLFAAERVPVRQGSIEVERTMCGDDLFSWFMLFPLPVGPGSFSLDHLVLGPGSSSLDHLVVSFDWDTLDLLVDRHSAVFGQFLCTNAVSKATH